VVPVQRHRGRWVEKRAKAALGLYGVDVGRKLGAVDLFAPGKQNRSIDDDGVDPVQAAERCRVEHYLVVRRQCMTDPLAEGFATEPGGLWHAGEQHGGRLTEVGGERERRGCPKDRADASYVGVTLDLAAWERDGAHGALHGRAMATSGVKVQLRLDPFPAPAPCGRLVEHPGTVGRIEQKSERPSGEALHERVRDAQADIGHERAQRVLGQLPQPRLRVEQRDHPGGVLWQRRQVEQRPGDAGNGTEPVGYQLDDRTLNGFNIAREVRTVEAKCFAVDVMGLFELFDRADQVFGIYCPLFEGNDDTPDNCVDLCPVDPFYLAKSALQVVGEAFGPMPSCRAHLDVGLPGGNPKMPPAPTARNAVKCHGRCSSRPVAGNCLSTISAPRV